MVMAWEVGVLTIAVFAELIQTITETPKNSVILISQFEN